MQLIGIVERQLTDKHGNAKPQFKDNSLWKFIKRHFGLDLQIPFLTGYWTTLPIKLNTVTTVGKQSAAKRLVGVTANAVDYIAIGTGSPGATTLGTEITTDGGQRVQGTASNETTTTTGDTSQLVNTFTFTASFAVTEEGLFDAASSGNMFASQSFSAVNVTSGDQLAITHKVVFS